jgi:hypothetical protein
MWYRFLFVHERIISTIKRVEIVGNRMPYIILRGRWCDALVLNVHATPENKIDGMKVSFQEELVRIFDKFPK